MLRRLRTKTTNHRKSNGRSGSRRHENRFATMIVVVLPAMMPLKTPPNVSTLILLIGKLDQIRMDDFIDSV